MVRYSRRVFEGCGTKHHACLARLQCPFTHTTSRTDVECATRRSSHSASSHMPPFPPAMRVVIPHAFPPRPAFPAPTPPLRLAPHQPHLPHAECLFHQRRDEFPPFIGALSNLATGTLTSIATATPAASCTNLWNRLLHGRLPIESALPRKTLPRNRSFRGSAC